jgi:thimet oligopeptidase
MRSSISLALLLCAPALAASQPAPNQQNAPVNWHPTPTTLTAQCDATLTRARSGVAAALARPLAQRSFENSIKPVETAFVDFGQEVFPLTFLYNVAPDSGVRAASAACDSKVQSYLIELGANPEIYTTALAVQKAGGALTPADRKLVALYIEAGRHSGAGLDAATREHTTALFKRLNDLQRDFIIALGADTTSITVSPTGIAGFPQQFVATLKRNAAGDYIVPANEATYSLVMRNATSSATREKYYTTYQTIGGAANVQRLSTALILRDSLAHLMSVPNWATYQLQIKTARTPERVMSFLNELDANLLPKARAEHARMAALKLANGDSTAFRQWDVGYYSQMLRRQQYSVDEEKLRQYFPVDKVVAGVLGIYSHLFGLRFNEIKPSDAWAADVSEYQVTDTVSGKPLGVVYLDLFPRPNKFNHFADWSVRSRIARPDGTEDQTIGMIVGNWPTPEPGKPSLLSHGDVITFFHEFGHLVDGALARSPYLTDLNLRQDFVEAPSQMLENWMWQPEVLALVSRNVNSGEPLPKAVIDKMIAAKHMQDGIDGTAQLFYGLYDMTLATSSPNLDPTAIWMDLMPKVTGTAADGGGVPEASFGHLMSGYDAGYYGYLWSKVEAQDLFTRFEKEGFLNPTTGMAYRRLVLEPGGLREPDELLQDFLGRPMSYEAFYRDMGVQKK